MILPWSNQSIPDSTFSPQGPIYQEQLKALVGTGGDSRESDANGIWFRVLVGAGNFATPQSTGGFLLSNLPIAGGNPPPPHEKPPFRPDVPCETQHGPNLNTIPTGPPAGQMPVNQLKTPEAQARWAKLQTSAVNWLKGQVEQAGLSKDVKVSSREVTPGEIPHLKALGRLAR